MLHFVGLLNASAIYVVSFFILLVPLLSQLGITSILGCFLSLIMLLEFNVRGVLSSSVRWIESHFFLMLQLLNQYTIIWMRTTAPTLNSTLSSKTRNVAIVFFVENFIHHWYNLLLDGFRINWSMSMRLKSDFQFGPYKAKILYHLWWTMTLYRFLWSSCFRYFCKSYTIHK